MLFTFFFRNFVSWKVISWWLVVPFFIYLLFTEVGFFTGLFSAIPLVFISIIATVYSVFGKLNTFKNEISDIVSSFKENSVQDANSREKLITFVCEKIDYDDENPVIINHFVDLALKLKRS